MVTTDTAIRRATQEDATPLLAFLIDLTARSAYVRQRVNPTHLAAMLGRLIVNPDAGFLVAERDDRIVGVLVLLQYDDLISGERRAAQVCWYVDPAHRDGVGAELLAAGEAWAHDHGACQIEMLAPEGKFESMYARRGYVPLHRVYERRLSPCRG